MSNMLALVQTKEGKFEPKVLNLKECIYYYAKHQEGGNPCAEQNMTLRRQKQGHIFWKA